MGDHYVPAPFPASTRLTVSSLRFYGAGESRTRHLQIANLPLYPMSYDPEEKWAPKRSPFQHDQLVVDCIINQLRPFLQAFPHQPVHCSGLQQTMQHLSALLPLP